jgi:adenylate cyclase
MRDPRSLWHELKRRKIWRTVAVYAAVSWGLLQLADVVWEPLGLPAWTMTLVIVLVVLGFPLVLTLEWIFDMTSEGVRRTPQAGEAPAGRSLMIRPLAVGSLALLVAFGAWRLMAARPSEAGSGVRPGPAAAGEPASSEIAAATAPALKRLAVLPFANVRRNPEMNFLGFALADQIIGAIAYVEDLIVRPSSAVRPYQDQTVDPETAGRELRVDYVLAGSFHEQDGAVRLNLELVEVETNELIWREGIEVEYESAFHLQDLVTEKVVDRLDVSFSQEERARLLSGVPADPLAYEYYLRALSYPLTVEGSKLAATMLEQSIALDSTYAPAFAELGYRLNQVATYDVAERARRVRGEAALRKALALNDELLGALSRLAAVYTELGRSSEAVGLLQRALRINPNSATARFYLGYVYRYAGCLDEAIAEQERAVALDPGNPRFRSIGTTYVYRGELDRALMGFDLDPESPFGLSWKGQVYMRMDSTQRALEYLNRAIELESEGIIGLWATAQEAYIVGDRERSLAAVRGLDRSDIFDAEQQYHAANLYGLLGEAEDAARELREAVEGGFINVAGMETDSFLDPVRADPGVQRVLEAARVRHEAFAAQHCSD